MSSETPDKIIKPKVKRLSKGQRTNTRRLKQAARKEAGIDNPQSNPVKTTSKKPL